jgi:hypothetical protein
MNIEVKKAILARAVAALKAIDAEYVIQVDELPLEQSEVKVTITPAEPSRSFQKPNVNRYRSWGYHELVKDMKVGIPVALPLPKDASPAEFRRVVLQYVGTMNDLSRKKSDWDIKFSDTHMYLTRLI